MIQLRKAENPADQSAKAVYAALLRHIRNPAFYRDAGVPDTMDGRFDLLVLHVFLIMNRLLSEGSDGTAFNQALFDILFKDMDQTLRETGVGDMRIAKHMRRMMRGFNGRAQAYNQALGDAPALAEALRRNLYGTLDDVPEAAIALMAAYIDENSKLLAAAEMQDLVQGRVILAPVRPVSRAA